jgi:hypothetical protein
MPSPISYHTFIYPFAWKSKQDEKLSDFLKMLGIKDLMDAPNSQSDDRGRKGSLHWKELTWANKIPEPDDISDSTCSNRCPIDRASQEQDWYERYSLSQYLNKPALTLSTGYQQNSSAANAEKIHIFEYRGINNQNSRGQGYYRIEKDFFFDGKLDRTERYELEVSAIRLKVFPHGAAIMSFELKFHGTKTIIKNDGEECGQPADLTDINRINEYGRRIRFPYFSEYYPDVMSSRIELHLSDGNETLSLCENFQHNNDRLFNNFAKYYRRVVVDYHPEHIFELLYVDSPKSKRTPAIERLTIKSLLDDRMFVCCLVKDDTLVNSSGRWDSAKGQYQYLLDYGKVDEYSASDNLYRFAYIEDSITCNSRTMRQDLLKESVYDRWIDWGTIYVATHHSFVCAVGKGARQHVIDSFLNLYVKLATIVLLQRTAILSLTEQAAAIAAGLYNTNDKEILDEIRGLYESFVEVESQILLQEVTPQEQGVELYRLLQKQLYIKESKDWLNGQLDNLYEYANITLGQLHRDKDEALNDKMLELTEQGKITSNRVLGLTRVMAILTVVMAIIGILSLLNTPVGQQIYLNLCCILQSLTRTLMMNIPLSIAIATIIVAAIVAYVVAMRRQKGKGTEKLENDNLGEG